MNIVALYWVHVFLLGEAGWQPGLPFPLSLCIMAWHWFGQIGPKTSSASQPKPSNEKSRLIIRRDFSSSLHR